MKRVHATNYGGLILRGPCGVPAKHAPGCSCAGVWHMRAVEQGIPITGSTGTGNRKVAETILAKRRAEIIDEVKIGGRKPIKLHDALDKFIKSRAHMPSGENCEFMLRPFRSLPDTTLDKVHSIDIEGVIQKRRADGIAESTLGVTITYFNAMLKYCEEHGYTARKKLKRPKKPEGKVRWLSKLELQKLLAELDPALANNDVVKAQKQENYDLVLLLNDTAGRFTEISKMTWNQVDFDSGTVFMKRLKGSISGTIEMTNTMREVFTRRRQMEPGDLVFSSKQQDRSESKWFRAAVKRAGLSEIEGTVTPHTLRHTRACHLLLAGMGLVELKEYLGHASIQSTMQYAHVIKSDVMSKAARLINADAEVA